MAKQGGGRGRDGRRHMREAGNSGEQMTAISSDGGGMRGETGRARHCDQAVIGVVEKGGFAGAAVAAAIPREGLQEGRSAVRGERCRVKTWGLRPRGDCRGKWRVLVLLADGRVRLRTAMCGTFGGGRATVGNAACRRRRTKVRFRHEKGRYGGRNSCGRGAGTSFLRLFFSEEPDPAASGK